MEVQSPLDTGRKEIAAWLVGDRFSSVTSVGSQVVRAKSASVFDLAGLSRPSRASSRLIRPPSAVANSGAGRSGAAETDDPRTPRSGTHAAEARCRARSWA